MVESAATDKLTRWISKRETFTRRDAFMGTKGGVMRSVADFDSALAVLMTEGVITLASEQPSRGTRYVVASPSDQVQDIRSFASPVVASTPAPIEVVARVEPTVTPAPEPVVPSPLPPIQPPTPVQIKTVERTADDVLASAAWKKLHEPNASCMGRLRDIEKRYGKSAGDNLRASDLHPSEIADLIRLGA